MKKLFMILIVTSILLGTLAGCVGRNSDSPKKESLAEESVKEQDSGDEQVSSVSEYFTDEQLESIRKSLRIPDSLSVEPEIGEPYYWDGGDMDLIQVDFYHDGEYVAGAACEPYTETVARNIYSYSE